jgi:hypothetical protein
MTTLIIFNNLGEKLYEEISKNTKELFQKMMNSQNAILSDKEGRRMTKGIVPKNIKNSLGRKL